MHANPEMNQELLALLRAPSLCYVTTLMPDGSPQLTQTWVDTDGQHIIINTVEGFQKLRNVQRDPRVGGRSVRPEPTSIRYITRPRPGRCHHHRRRYRAHRVTGAEIPRRPLPVVRRSRPGPHHRHHRCREVQRSWRVESRDRRLLSASAQIPGGRPHRIGDSPNLAGLTGRLRSGRRAGRHRGVEPFGVGGRLRPTFGESCHSSWRPYGRRSTNANGQLSCSVPRPSVCQVR